MKKEFLLLIMLVIGLTAKGQAIFNSAKTGLQDWNDFNSWVIVSGTDLDGIPDVDDQVNITSGCFMNILNKVSVSGLNISNGGLYLNDTLIINGNVNINIATVTVNNTLLSIFSASQSLVILNSLQLQGTNANVEIITPENNQRTGRVSINASNFGNESQPVKLKISTTSLNLGNTNGNNFYGDLTISTSFFVLNSNHFYNGLVSLTQNGTIQSQDIGGNVFEASTSLTIANTNSGLISLSFEDADTIKGNLNVNHLSGRITLGSRSNTVLYGNLNTIGSLRSTVLGSSTGFLVFMGAGDQTINTTPTIRVIPQNTEVNKPSGRLILTSLFRIPRAGKLKLTSGIISASTAAPVQIGRFVSHSLGTNNSFIDGPCIVDVRASLPVNVRFPVGKGNDWRPVVLSVQNTQNFITRYTVEVVNESAAQFGLALPSGVSNVSTNRYYKITRTASVPTNRIITLSADFQYGMNDGIKTRNNPVVLFNRNGSGAWQVVGGNPTNNGVGNMVTNNPLDDVGLFAFGNVDYTIDPLPVDLISFSGKKVENQTLLNWKTANELNFSHFEVQYSKNAFDFETFSIVQSQGNLSTGSEYQQLHASPITGKNYYRLKMVDHDGKFEYSKTVIISFNTLSIDLKLTLYPNPVGNNSNTLYVTTNGNESVLSVLNLEGKLVLQKNIHNLNEQLDISNLADGLYVVQLQSNGNAAYEKLVVQH